MSAGSATVLVTPRSYREADPESCRRLEAAVAEVRFNDRGRPLTAAELGDELGDVDGVVAGLDRFDAGVFESAPRLRVIARYGVGTDAIDLDAAREAGVIVTNTPGANAVAVAELAVGLVFALLRRIVELDRRSRAGDWSAARGRELTSRTVGVLGLGRVGIEFAKRMRALGARVVAHDPYCDRGLAAELGITLADLTSMLEQAEVLSLHAPVTPDTEDVIGREALAALPDGALLVNTARGELLVESELAASLESGRLAGAALDALRDEPPASDHPLLRRDDVIVTPHVGAQTVEARAAMARGATEDVLAVLDGRRPRAIVVGDGA